MTIRLALLASLTMAACGPSVSAVVTVELVGTESQAGACPTPPGESRPCVQQLVSRAAFAEHAGVNAEVEGVTLFVCHGEGCERFVPTKGMPSFHLSGHGLYEVVFNPSHTGAASSITVRATVTSEGSTYPVEAPLRGPGDA